MININLLVSGVYFWFLIVGYALKCFLLPITTALSYLQIPMEDTVMILSNGASMDLGPFKELKTQILVAKKESQGTLPITFTDYLSNKIENPLLTANIWVNKTTAKNIFHWVLVTLDGDDMTGLGLYNQFLRKGFTTELTPNEDSFKATLKKTQGIPGSIEFEVYSQGLQEGKNLSTPKVTSLNISLGPWQASLKLNQALSVPTVIYWGTNNQILDMVPIKENPSSLIATITYYPRPIPMFFFSKLFDPTLNSYFIFCVETFCMIVIIVLYVAVAAWFRKEN